MSCGSAHYPTPANDANSSLPLSGGAATSAGIERVVNRWLFLQTKDPKAFEQAAKVPESYRHFAAPSRGRQPGASAIETRAKEPASEASEEPP
jgi:hypothetical protein